MTIYLDSAPIIYLIEKVSPYESQVVTRITASGVVICSSDLALMEVLIRPLRRQDQTLMQQYTAFFAQQLSLRASFHAAVFRRAAEIRAVHNFQTPDALHLAVAVEAGGDVFLTNDLALQRFTDLTVEIIH